MEGEKGAAGEGEHIAESGEGGLCVSQDAGKASKQSMAAQSMANHGPAAISINGKLRAWAMKQNDEHR